MKRSDAIICLLCGVLAALLVSSCGIAPAPEKPNVLFIAIDDMNDWAGCLRGHPQAQTPNIDRLASQGVLFTNAHTPSPLCTPSRTSVFTGLMPDRTRVYSNGDSLEKQQQGLATLPFYFRAHGYKTLTAGKTFPVGGEYPTAAWTVEGPGASVKGPQGGPFTKDEYNRRGKPEHYLVERLGVTRPLSGMIDRRAHSSTGSFDWGAFDLPDEAFGDGVVAEWAAEQLRSMNDEPFFFAVGFFRPHQPLYAPKKYFEPFPPDSTTLPETREDDLEDVSEAAKLISLIPATSGLHSWVVEAGQWRNAVASYLACIRFADAQVGKILDALEESGHADDTIIAIWSDHGWHLGEKQHWGKFTGWEESTRVPMVLVLPPSMRKGNLAEAFRPGREFTAASSLMDLYPTLTDLAGLPPVEGLDGRNLVPELRGEPAADTPAIVVTFGRGNYTVVRDNWRYIHYFDGSEELYNVAEDPSEFTNLSTAPEHRPQLDAMRRHVPDDPELSWTARYGQYKVVAYREGDVLLYDLKEADNVTDRGSIAAERPDIVERVQAFVSQNKILEKHFVVPEAAP